MKALRTVSTLTAKTPTLLCRFLSAQPQQNIDYQEPIWDDQFGEGADRLVLGEKTQKGKLKTLQEREEEQERRRLLVFGEEEEELVREENQKSLSPNAGKSAFTSYMVCLFVSFISFLGFGF